jgi:hypothetical protein
LSENLFEGNPMSMSARPARSAVKPVRSSPEARTRAQRIFARLIGGQSVRAVAEAETLSVRRVQQIIRQELQRRDADPADDYALLQIARLERALDLLGGQIDAGKPAAVHAFVRVLDHLNRLAPERLRLKTYGPRIGDEADKMAERFERLDAAREALALKDAERAPRNRANAAQSNRVEVIENKGNGEMADFAPSMISEA